MHTGSGARKEKKRKYYTFRQQFNEKPSILPGCPAVERQTLLIAWQEMSTEIGLY